MSEALLPQTRRMVGGSAERLAQHGVETDPETLRVLRFEFVPDDRLRKAMTASWPGESAAPPSSRR